LVGREASLGMTNGMSKHVLDRWIMAKLHELVKEVTEGLENYKLAEASRPIGDFITELSQWYVRRIRDRVKDGSDEEKAAALGTLREVLLTLSKLMAPFTPFIAERVWQELEAISYKLKAESIHLQSWPTYHAEHHDHTVLEQMAVARKIVEMGLALRAENKLKVRQPLAALLMNKESMSHELLQMIAEELNVKKVEFAEYQEPGNGWMEKVDGEIKVWLHTTVDEQLKKEGLLREVIRTINQMRKEQKLTIADRVVISYHTDDRELQQVFSEFGEEIQKAVLADQVVAEKVTEVAPLEIEGKTVRLMLSPG
ncbi:MAG TPA: class I tRNA ligase family protein, partial [Patescibacteria group bacterium]|nr:class I tRNA ligase family protein [Patescibacteria group bacterium]